MIHVDTREPNIMRLLVSAAVNGDTNDRALYSADYAIFDAASHSLGAERKEGNDLLNALSESMANGEKRLLDQVRRMRETYDHTLLVIEKFPTYVDVKHTLGRSAWSHGAVQMILWQIEQEGTAILYTDSKKATADLLRILNQRAARGCVLPHIKAAA